MKFRILGAFIFFYFFLFSFATVTTTYALISPPSFPSCVNPQGTLKVSYSSGVHGVPGKVDEFRGSDSVYSLTPETLIQCLCPENGDGIQTNWWKIPSLTGGEIESFKTQGWVFVPDGNAWGLDPAAYLARNVSFSCRAGGIGGFGDIIGLATTGNMQFILSLLISGIISIGIGVILLTQSKDSMPASRNGRITNKFQDSSLRWE